MPILQFFRLKSIFIKILLASTLILTISLVLLNFIWISYVIPSKRQDLSSLQIVTANRAVDNIINYITLNKSIILNLLSIGEFSSAPIDKKEEILNIILKNHTVVEQIDFIDAKGDEQSKISRYNVYTKADYKNIKDTELFQKVSENTEYTSPVYFKDAVPFITYAFPTQDSNSKITGIVSAQLNLSNLWNTLSSIKPTPNGYAYIVGPDGHLIAHPDFDQVLKNNNVKDRKCVQKVLVEKKICTGLEPQERYSNEKNVPVYPVGILIPEYGWAVMVESPVSEISGSINKFITYSVTIISFTLIWAIILSVWLSRALTNPIRSLEKGARMFGIGNFRYRLNIKTGDEIELVANAFNQMATQLGDLYKNLEAKVTERTRLLQQRTQEVGAERNKFAVILQGISDGVFALDNNKNIILFNHAAEIITGISAKEALGRNVSELLRFFEGSAPISPDEFCPPPKVLAADQIVFNKPRLSLQTKYGKRISVNLISAQIKEGISTNLGCIATIHDNSKEQELENMKLDFVSMAAHELRTPLTSIKGYLSVFMNENKGKFSKDQEDLLNHINMSTQQLITLIENLLGVSKVERGMYTVQTAPMQWDQYVESVVEEFKLRAIDKKITLTFTPSPQPLPDVQADKMRINEVLSNLISNAINYTDPGGSIKVWTEKKGEEVITHITDTGKGIPPEAIHNLFTKFYRVRSVLSQSTKGTGLGLYISKAIVDLHHGRIWVESQLGKGSTFSFSLPVKTY